MNSYLELIGKYANAHRKKNRLTVVCIMIAVMLVSAIFGMADMSVKGQINEQIRIGGNYHIMLDEVPVNMTKQIENRKDVSFSGYIIQTENVKAFGEDVQIMGGEEKIAEQMNLKVEEGKFPATNREVLIDGYLSKRFAVSIGDKLSIDVLDGRTMEFVISGIFQALPGLQGSGSHGLFLNTSGIKTIENGKQNNFYAIQFKQGTNIRKATKDIAKKLNLESEQIIENKVLLGVMGQSDDSTIMQLYLTVGILFILVLLAGSFMISSSFNLNIAERIRFFGMLRCLGATKKQIKRYVRLEALRYGSIGIPLGLLVGSMIMWLALFFLKSSGTEFFKDLPTVQISWIGLTAGTVMGFLVIILASNSPSKKASKITPQAAVTGHSNRQVRVVSKKRVKMDRLPVEIALGIRHAFERPKNVFLMTGSFAISIIMLLCFTVLLSFMNHATRPLLPSAPDISITTNDKSATLSTLFFEKVANIEGVKNAYRRSYYYDIQAENETASSKVNLISYDNKQFDWAQKQLNQGDLEDARSGNQVLLVHSKTSHWRVGETINLKTQTGNQKIKIAGILSNSPLDAKEGTVNLICSEKTFREITNVSDFTVIDLQVKESVPFNMPALTSLLTPQMKLIDKIQSNKDIRNAYRTMSIFIHSFLIVIALVALMNIVNTINVSVASRVNNFGVMRAVGMSNKQLKKMVVVEAASYAVTGSVFGSGLGVFLHWRIFNLIISSIWGEAWRPPVRILVIIIIATILTTIIATLCPVKKIKQMSIIEIVNSQ